MKYSPDDFKDKLAGKQDKVAAVNAIKEAHANAGLHVSVKRRKLAGGVKIYFTVTPPKSMKEADGWYDNVANVRAFSKDTIGKHFPESSLTSGGTFDWTIAEY